MLPDPLPPPPPPHSQPAARPDPAAPAIPDLSQHHGAIDPHPSKPHDPSSSRILAAPASSAGTDRGAGKDAAARPCSTPTYAEVTTIPPPSAGPHDRTSPPTTPAPAINTPGCAPSPPPPAPGRALAIPSSLSLDVEPFFPGGRGKQLRWRDVTPPSDGERGHPCASYRDALLRPAVTPATTTDVARPRLPSPAAARSVHDRLGPLGEFG